MPWRDWGSPTVREETGKRIREQAKATGLTVDGPVTSLELILRVYG